MFILRFAIVVCLMVKCVMSGYGPAVPYAGMCMYPGMGCKSDAECCREGPGKHNGYCGKGEPEIGHVQFSAAEMNRECNCGNGIPQDAQMCRCVINNSKNVTTKAQLHPNPVCCKDGKSAVIDTFVRNGETFHVSNCEGVKKGENCTWDFCGKGLKCEYHTCV